MGGPRKGSWGTGYLIEPKPNEKLITCNFCWNYNKDGSCMAQPIVISEVGYNYWKYCRNFELSSEFDTIENRKKVNRIKGERSLYFNATHLDFTIDVKPTYKRPRNTYNKDKLRKQTEKINVNCKGIKLGSTVTLHDYRENKKVVYKIVPMNQGNPVKNKISIKSPLAIALLGNNVGDIIEVDVFSGVEKYKVISILHKE